MKARCGPDHSDLCRLAMTSYSSDLESLPEPENPKTSVCTSTYVDAATLIVDLHRHCHRQLKAADDLSGCDEFIVYSIVFKWRDRKSVV